MSKNFSQIFTELYARPVEGEDLYFRIRNVGEEIRKMVQSGETMSGRFQGLLESFRGIIPDEQQRYQAALKALSTTSKLGRQEVINAMNSQFEELKVLERGLMPSHAGWDGELQAMETRSQMLKGEMANLRARIAQLESEEQLIQAGIAVRGKYLALVEKTVKELFANIGAEIAALNKKVEELPAEASAAQPGSSTAPQTPPAQQPNPRAEETIPQKVPVKSDVPGKQKEGGEQKVEIKAEPVPVDSKFQRKCPQCGGPFHLLELENIWQCFTCGHEEPSTGAVQGTSEEKSEPMDALTPAETPGLTEEAASSSIEPASMVIEPAGSKKGPSRSGSQPGANKKSCPVCYKKMIWYPGEKIWRCPSGHHERRGGPGPGSR